MSEGTPQAPIAAPATELAITNQPQQAPQTVEDLMELNVNGQTRKLSKEEAKKYAQLGLSANERFEAGAKLSRKAEEIIGEATKNPIGSLIKAGLSKEQIKAAMEEWYTREFIEPESLTPEQLKLRDAESELERYRREERESKEKRDQEEQEKLTATQRERLQKQIMDALDTSGLPKTAFIAARIAFYMRENLSKGWGAPMELIVEQVKREEQERWRQTSGGSSVEQIIALLGEDLINKIRAHDLQKLRERRGMPKESQPSQSGTRERESTRLSMNEVSRRLKKLQFGE